MNVHEESILDAPLAARAEGHFHEDLLRIHRKVDLFFVVLMAIQWVAGIACALWLTPHLWADLEDCGSFHLWLAILGGALFMGPPAAMALLAPGRFWTRHLIAVGQILQSALLIHLTAGDPETQLHTIGSLALLAFYRDWRVLITGSAVVFADHLLRGQFWPQSLYGAAEIGRFEWLEHMGWVAFVEVFLVGSCLRSIREMRGTALRQTRLEAHQELIEREVERRTRDLRESEEKFRQMAQNIDEVFWVTNPDLSQIHYISPGYQKIWGRPLADLEAHPESWAEAIHPEDRERVWAAASNHASSGKYAATYRILRPDGEIRWVYDHGNAIRNSDGIVVRLAGSVVDITALKAAEEKLVRSNVELERFAYVASHDLQEPLRSVSSFLQLLQRRYKGRLDDDADEYIRFAVDGAHRMKQLIADLLAYGRLDAQARPMEAVSLDVMLDIAVENLRETILESGARITHDPLPEIRVDGAQIAQVFQNLISNAIKFRGDRRPEIHLGVERTGAGWTLSVRDNGIGIAPEFADRIFMIFQRLHGQKYPGSGIGLTICKKIVERHQGRIWMESAPGRGTTFHFSLPAETPKTAAPAAAPAASRRVLVVDDDPMSRKLIRKSLESLGILVEEAQTGPEGLEKARAMRPAAILLDVNLPGLDGNQVRRALRRDAATRDIPVVMITSEAELLEPEFAVAADWMAKPLSPEELRNRVQTLVPMS